MLTTLQAAQQQLDLLAAINRAIELTRGILCYDQEHQTRLTEARDLLIVAASKAAEPSQC